MEGLRWVKGQRKFLQEWFKVGILGKQYWWYCCDVSHPPVFNESMICGNRGPEPGVTRRESVWHSPAPYLTAPHSEICRNHIGGLQSLHWCGMWLMPTVSKSQILGYSSWHLDLWRKKHEADKWRNERSCALKEGENESHETFYFLVQIPHLTRLTPCFWNTYVSLFFLGYLYNLKINLCFFFLA